jgi:hypothetical protein
VDRICSWREKCTAWSRRRFRSAATSSAADGTRFRSNPVTAPSVRRRGRARDLSRRASLGSRRARRCAGTQRTSSASDPGPRSRSSQRRFLGHCGGRSSCFVARPSRRRIAIEVNFVWIWIPGEISSDESADRRFPRAAVSTANPRGGGSRPRGCRLGSARSIIPSMAGEENSEQIIDWVCSQGLINDVC